MVRVHHGELCANSLLGTLLLFCSIATKILAENGRISWTYRGSFARMDLRVLESLVGRFN